MSNQISIQATINFPKVEKMDDNYSKFTAQLLLKKQDAANLNKALELLRPAAPKAVNKLKEIDHNKFDNLPSDFTHMINVSTNAEWLKVMDIKRNQLPVAELKSGDLVYCLLKTGITRASTSKQFLGAFVNTIALVTKGYVELRGKSSEESSFFEQLDALAVDTPANDEIEL